MSHPPTYTIIAHRGASDLVDCYPYLADSYDL